MKRLSMILASLWMTCGLAFAQAHITVQVPSVVSLDEQFRLVFVIEGERVSDFQWPGTEDFSVQWGPQSGSSSQTSIINGKVSKTVSTSYTYVLMPVKEGVFTIPSCSVKVKGKTLTSDPVSVKVGKAQSSSTSSGEDLFMTLVLDKKEVVLGEPVNATLKLYTRVPIGGFEDVKFPSFDGFWSQVTESPNTVDFHRESLNGEVYDASVLRRYSIVPQKAGDLVIDPAQMVCLVQV
ncbi:MAG: BatD family protein, partial [Candidatus Cryptobacteroides sp.]